MKILYISDAKSIHTQRWANYFASEGHEVHIASFRYEELSNIKVHKLNIFGLGKLGYLFSILQLKRIYAELKPDIVHAQYITSYGFIAALGNTKPLIVTAWGSDILIAPKESWILKKLVKYTLKKADLVTTVAKHMNKAIYQYCTSCKDVNAMPFGIDLDIFVPSPVKKIEGQQLRIISTRNFNKVYSIDTLIYAMEYLKKNGISCHLDLVGDGVLRHELEDLVHRLSLDHMVTFYGHIEENRLVRLLQDADIFVSTAVSDGNNVSLNEAMGCGCFPIATNIPANSQWITHGSNGLLFDVYDFKSLGTCIIEAKDIELREYALKSNRDIVESKANWKNCAEDMTKQYLQLMTKR